MDKLKLAHDWAMKSFLTDGFKNEAERANHAWQYAKAMQAEADKLIHKERPGVLCEVDWSQAPNDAIGWVMMQNHSYWHGDEGYLIENAPSFGFTGSHIMERPHGF